MTKKQTSRKRFWLVGGGLGVLVLTSLAFWQRGLFMPAPVSATQASYQTITVERGDIDLTISGTVSLKPKTTVDLAFYSSGTVGALNVQLGDRVSAGQILAALSEIDELEIKLRTKQLGLQTAQKNLEDLLASGDKALAQGLTDRAAAQLAYEEAVNNLRHKGEQRCTSAVIGEYFEADLAATNEITKWERENANNTDPSQTNFIIQQIENAIQDEEFAAYNLAYCEEYTDLEILESEANLNMAKEELAYRDTIYQKLLVSAGIDPVELEIAQAEVQNAELQLTQAQNQLDGATIIAPMDGTVMEISGGLGDGVGTQTFITLSDLNNQIAEAVIDETDLQNFEIGCSAQLVFDALPNHTFDGTVTQIYPSLQNNSFVFGVQGQIDLNDSTLIPGLKLTTGLNGSVEISCRKAQNVLKIPIAALYETTVTPPHVYILNAEGQPEKQMVEVGVIGDAYVEIQSGLNEGDEVITSTMPQD
jgi:HlyD family secretion protein